MIDDLIEYALWIFCTLGVLYFGAHFLAYLLSG